MSSQFLNGGTSPSRLGHVLLTGVFISVGVLMAVPKVAVIWDSNNLSVGDSVTVWTPYPSGLKGGNRTISELDGDRAKITTNTGDSAWIPVKYLHEK